MNIKIINRDECKQIQLKLLCELDKICRKEGLQYYIAYGSLLGAVRHGGFIPWDDDIDICMLRADYQKLLSVVKTGICDWISIVDADCEGYYMPFAKAVDNRTIAKQDDTKLEHGIWVDIFPLDGIPSNAITQKLYLKKAHFLRNIMLSAITDFTSEKSKNDPKRKVKQLLNWGCHFFGGPRRLLAYFDKYSQRYDADKTGKVGCLGTPYVSKEIIDLADAKNLKDYDFEGYKFLGLVDSDKYLRMLYGNYMQLPPEDKRRTHSITAWYINDKK